MSKEKTMIKWLLSLANAHYGWAALGALVLMVALIYFGAVVRSSLVARKAARARAEVDRLAQTAFDAQHRDVVFGSVELTPELAAEHFGNN